MFPRPGNAGFARFARLASQLTVSWFRQPTCPLKSVSWLAAPTKYHPGRKYTEPFASDSKATAVLGCPRRVLPVDSSREFPTDTHIYCSNHEMERVAAPPTGMDKVAPTKNKLRSPRRNKHTRTNALHARTAHHALPFPASQPPQRVDEKKNQYETQLRQTTHTRVIISSWYYHGRRHASSHFSNRYPNHPNEPALRPGLVWMRGFMYIRLRPCIHNAVHPVSSLVRS